MLIDNKFLFVSLPRRASTSFHFSCLLNGLDVKNIGPIDWSINNSKIDFNALDEANIMDHISHGHEKIVDLKKNYGNSYPIISIRRNRHESFYSYFKHLIFDLERAGFPKISKHFSGLSARDLFFFNTNDLKSSVTRYEKIISYLYANGLIKNKTYTSPSDLSLNTEEYVINVIDILLTPMSHWHNNDKEIIWFDIDNLTKLEEWVSNITKKPFKLKKLNSNAKIKCKLELNDEFIHYYNGVYDYYDLPKIEKTLI